MSIIYYYDPTDPVVTNRVKKIVYSADTGKYQNVENILINPSASETNITYMKRVGYDIVSMTASEKQAVDAALAAENAQRLADQKDFTKSFDKLLKAFALIVLDEINALRIKAGLTERTIEQLKTTIKNKYDTL